MSTEQKKTARPKAKPDIESDLAIARAAQQRRREEAPLTTLAQARKVPQKVQMETYAPECIDKKDGRGRVIKKADWHGMHGDRDKYREYLQAGYEPVLDERGEPVYYGGDPALKIPVELYERDLKQAKMLSDAMVGEKFAEESANTKANPVAQDEVTELIKPGDPRYDQIEKGDF